MRFDISNWPRLQMGETKTVYIEGTIPQKDISALRGRGYRVVDVRTLPRDDPNNNKVAIQAYLQGMMDGTISATDERRKALELSAKLDGLLINKKLDMKITGDLSEETLENLLTFSKSRHTLIVTSDEQIEQAQLSGRIPGPSKQDPKNGKIHKDQD